MEFVPCTLNDNVCLKIDISDLPIEKMAEAQSMLIFDLESYAKAKKADKTSLVAEESVELSNWDIIFGHLNGFLAGLTEEQAMHLVHWYIATHALINKTFQDSPDIWQVNHMFDEIGNSLDELDKTIDLYGLLLNHVESRIQYQMMEDAGKRAQDSQDITWYPNQVEHLIAIALLCKLMTPIYGTLMGAISKVVNPTHKADLCSRIVLKTLTRRCEDILEKMKCYLRHFISKKHNEEASSLMLGFSTESLVQHTFTEQFVKKFVNADLHRNIMAGLMMAAKRAPEQIRQTTNKHPTRERKDFSKVGKGGDEDGPAQMEIDSVSSNKTLAILPIMALSVDDNTLRLLKKYAIDADVFDMTVTYYLAHPIVPTILNEHLNAAWYSDMIGGSSGMEHLHSLEYTKLTALLQLILFTMGEEYADLAHMLTAVPAASGLGSMDLNTLVIRSTSGRAYERVYNLIEQNAFDLKGKDWERIVRIVAQELSSKKFLYNTAPIIWDIRTKRGLEDGNLNNTVITPTHLVMEAFSDIYLMTLEVNEA